MIKFAVTALILLALAGGSLALYLLPLAIGLLRRVPDIGSIAAINILLGWTFIGWTVAIALALRTVKADGPAVQIVQHLAPGRPQAALPAGDDGAGRPSHRPAPPPLVLPPGPGGMWCRDEPETADNGEDPDWRGPAAYDQAPGGQDEPDPGLSAAQPMDLGALPGRATFWDSDAPPSPPGGSDWRSGGDR